MQKLLQILRNHNISKARIDEIVKYELNAINNADLAGMEDKIEFLIKTAGLSESKILRQLNIDVKELHEDIYHCYSCQFQGDRDSLPDAKDILSRLEVGDAYSDKECPKCGALCFPLED